MAKVKIQGNASGTGVLTVTAPNTSTDRTITLPDSTGTLATTADSVGGATGVDFNDNVKARFGTGNDAEIYFDGTDTYIKSPSEILLRSDTNENMIKCVKDAQVNLYYDNALKLNTTATGIAVTGGVAIGGTGTANTLDDYEEGTWTPVLADASGNAIAGSQSGFYTKIGRAVHFEFNLNVGSHSGTTAGNEAQVNGLPFAVANTIYSPHTTSCGSMASNVGDCVIFQIFPSTSYGRFYKDNWNTSSHVSVKIQDFGTSGFVRCSGTYYST